jgi:hypothetical protein
MSYPPRVPVAFRVGVIGHRLNRLPTDPDALDALEARLSEILRAVAKGVEAFAGRGEAFYAAEPVRLVAVSPLAEGSDRLFAAAALDLGYSLCTPMPFFQAEFEKDFGPPDGISVAEFRALLARAETRFELDGSRNDAPAAYAAAGRVVLNQSDLLVAVWDGDDSRGQGGTAETLHEALNYHVPVLWVRSRAPFGWSLIRGVSDLTRGIGGCDPGHIERLVTDLVEQELRLPDDNASLTKQEGALPEPITRAATYFEEKPPASWRHLFWKSFRNLIGGGGPVWPRPRTPDFIGAALAEEGVTGDPELIAHFAWADRLADYYADAHRSNVVLASFLSATAVFLGVTPIMLHLGEHDRIWLILVTTCELFVVIALSRSFRRAQRRRWHEKWLEYRMLAEWIRPLRFLIPLGGGRPLLRSRAHLAVYGEPLRSWMYWQVRAIARARSLPSAVADKAHVARCLDSIITTLGDARSGQIGFHEATMHRSESIRERLHHAATLLVRVVILSIAIHLMLLILHVEPPEPGKALFEALILLCAAFIPALSAAFANINNQGEFARLAKRARAMRDALRRLHEEAVQMRARLDREEVTVTLAQVSSLASRTAATMLEEVVDWRVVVLDLPQGLE